MGLALGSVLAKLARVVTDGQEKEGGSNSAATSFSSEPQLLSPVRPALGAVIESQP